jgi:anti-sigma factor RsiW
MMPMSAPFPPAAPRLEFSHVMGSACDRVRARLHEYVDLELDERNPSDRATRLAMAAHLDGCVHCARLESQLHAIRVALAEVGACMRAPGSICARLHPPARALRD